MVETTLKFADLWFFGTLALLFLFGSGLEPIGILRPSDSAGLSRMSWSSQKELTTDVRKIIGSTSNRLGNFNAILQVIAPSTLISWGLFFNT